MNNNTDEVSQDVNEKYIQLIDIAKSAAHNSYSPYSKFRVGAALLTNNGNIYVGTNVENRSYGGTICAERVAIVNAISAGDKGFEAICIVGLDTAELLPPCGICRQFISEFGDIDIIMADIDNNYKVMKISDLLPQDSLHDLKKV